MYNADYHVGLKIHFGLESEMMNATGGDWEYRDACRNPVQQYQSAQLDETPPILNTKIRGIKKRPRCRKLRHRV